MLQTAPLHKLVRQFRLCQSEWHSQLCCQMRPKNTVLELSKALEKFSLLSKENEQMKDCLRFLFLRETQAGIFRPAPNNTLHIQSHEGISFCFAFGWQAAEWQEALRCLSTLAAQELFHGDIWWYMYIYIFIYIYCSIVCTLPSPRTGIAQRNP